MNITTIEYNAIMQAINNAKAAVLDEEFIDPYADTSEQPDGSHLYTNEMLLEALESIENKIMAVYLE